MTKIVTYLCGDDDILWHPPKMDGIEYVCLYSDVKQKSKHWNMIDVSDHLPIFCKTKKQKASWIRMIIPEIVEDDKIVIHDAKNMFTKKNIVSSLQILEETDIFTYYHSNRPKFVDECLFYILSGFTPPHDIFNYITHLKLRKFNFEKYRNLNIPYICINNNQAIRNFFKDWRELYFENLKYKIIRDQLSFSMSVLENENLKFSFLSNNFYDKNSKYSALSFPYIEHNLHLSSMNKKIKFDHSVARTYKPLLENLTNSSGNVWWN